MIQFEDIRIHHYPVRTYQFDRNAWIEEMHGKQYSMLLGLTESFTQIRCTNILVIPTSGAVDTHSRYLYILSTLKTELNLPPDTPIFTCDLTSYYIQPADDKKEAQQYKQQLHQQVREYMVCLIFYCVFHFFFFFFIFCLFNFFFLLIHSTLRV